MIRLLRADTIENELLTSLAWLLFAVGMPWWLPIMLGYVFRGWV